MKKTQNLGNQTKLSSSDNKNIVTKISSLTILGIKTAGVLTIVLLQLIIIAQNNLIGTNVEWIKFLIEPPVTKEKVNGNRNKDALHNRGIDNIRHYEILNKIDNKPTNTYTDYKI